MGWLDVSLCVIFFISPLFLSSPAGLFITSPPSHRKAELCMVQSTLLGSDVKESKPGTKLLAKTQFWGNKPPPTLAPSPRRCLIIGCLFLSLKGRSGHLVQAKLESRDCCHIPSLFVVFLVAVSSCSKNSAGGGGRDKFPVLSCTILTSFFVKSTR